MATARKPFTVLDVTKWYGETSGGVRTYLNAKRDYVRERSDLRHVLVIPGEQDSITQLGNTTCYRLRGPRIPTQRQYRFLLAPRSLRLIIEREQPDVIEVGSPFAVPWLTRFATRRVSIPLVSFYHTSLGTAASMATTSPPLQLLGGRLASAYVRRLDALFEATLVACDGVAEELRLAGAKRVERVSLGVDLEMFTPERRAHATWTRGRYGLPLNSPVVGYLGRLAHEKNLRVLVDGWAEVERRTGATLLIVGAGPLEPALRRAGAGRNIVWLPFESRRHAVADLLAAIDVAVSPGIAETFGLAALEAMACGTPVATADRGGVGELVRKSGGGALFPANDAPALAEAIIGLLGDRGSTAGRLARHHAETQHAWPRIFDQIFSLYRQVAA